jgi:hypothetical protein
MREGAILDYYDELIDAESRILVLGIILSKSIYYLFEYLYDLGYRRGDFVVIGTQSIFLVR